MSHLTDCNKLISLSRLYPCTPLIDLARCIVDPAPPVHPPVPALAPVQPHVPACPPIPEDDPGRTIIRKLYGQCRKRNIPSQDILSVAQSAYLLLATANTFTPSAIWVACRRACQEYRIALYGTSKAPEINDKEYHAICCSNPAQPRRAVHEAARWTKRLQVADTTDPADNDESPLIVDLTSDLQSNLATILDTPKYDTNRNSNPEFNKIRKYFTKNSSQNR